MNWKLRLGRRAQLTIKMARKDDPRWWYLDQYGLQVIRVTGFEYSYREEGFVISFVFFRLLVAFAKLYKGVA